MKKNQEHSAKITSPNILIKSIPFLIISGYHGRMCVSSLQEFMWIAGFLSGCIEVSYRDWDPWCGTTFDLSEMRNMQADSVCRHENMPSQAPSIPPDNNNGWTPMNGTTLDLRQILPINTANKTSL